MGTGGTRATISAAAAVLGGLTLTGDGVLTEDLPRVVAGTCLATAALVIAALLLVHRWVVDTADARKALAAAQREAERERSRYFAAQAALENEQGRLNRDMAAARANLAARLAAERQAMEDEFEERRGDVINEAMEATVRMFNRGKFAPDAARAANLIQFPHQERVRAREHGVVGP